MALKVAVVSGDGLPVSGLLTSMRNAVALGQGTGLVADRVPVELGYSWRPDKGWYPNGPADRRGLPAGWTETRMRWPAHEETGMLALELVAIQQQIACYETLTADQVHWLGRQIDRVAELYEVHFATWLAREQPDVVVAMNITLTDAVPATQGLYLAADAYFEARGRGCLLVWDHDLLGSYARRDDGGRRYYPPVPNQLTPLPARNDWTRWAVVSDALAREAAGYPGEHPDPIVVPNLVPSVWSLEGSLATRHQRWLHHHGVGGRRVLLAPVRVVREKGVDLSLRLLGALRAESERRGQLAPVLTIAGALHEDADYAREMQQLAGELGVESHVIWADGVPLATYRDQGGVYHLDELDLLRVVRETNGGVIFTPNTRDVESVGLGPALAAVAGVPVAVTTYDAYAGIYGTGQTGYAAVLLGVTGAGLASAARELLDDLDDALQQRPDWIAKRERNRAIVAGQFPHEPWSALWQRLAAEIDQ